MLEKRHALSRTVSRLNAGQKDLFKLFTTKFSSSYYSYSSVRKIGSGLECSTTVAYLLSPAFRRKMYMYSLSICLFIFVVIFAYSMYRYRDFRCVSLKSSNILMDYGHKH